MAIIELTEQEKAGRDRILNDTAYFAEKFLKIRDKAGQLVPLKLNRAQQYLHAQIETQRAQTGKVRVIGLKGRQQGYSTYCAARFFHQVSLRTGRRAFIMAHEARASNNLFGMVKRFHEHLPEVLRHPLSATNAQELNFAGADSGYRVVTAGSQDTGRSATAQLLHASEVGFWANASSHLAGIGNTVADLPGTEIILESTGNGVGGGFHSLWQKAEMGEGEYIPIFVPWSWQDEYRAEVKGTLDLDEHDELYKETYGLDLAQMQWRANKIATYEQGLEWLFDQEYPAVPALAFQTPTRNPLISPTIVQRAVNSGYATRQGAFVIGCDPAEGVNRDRTAIVFRTGRVVWRTESHSDIDTMEAACLLAKYFQEFQPDAIIVDRIGIGSGMVSRLRELNVPVIGAHSGEKAREPDIYLNKRAEMWWEMLEWLKDTPCRIPNDPGLISDLSAPGIKLHSSSRKQLESKESMANRDVRSPDIGDALALTFAEPVQPRHSSAMMVRNAESGHPTATRSGY